MTRGCVAMLTSLEKKAGGRLKRSLESLVVVKKVVCTWLVLVIPIGVTEVAVFALQAPAAASVPNTAKRKRRKGNILNQSGLSVVAQIATRNCERLCVMVL